MEEHNHFSISSLEIVPYLQCVSNQSVEETRSSFTFV